MEDLTITSVNDSTHSKNSKHYSGQALDIRSKNFPSKDSKHRFIQALGEDLHGTGTGLYTILLEDEGKANEHIHVQVKKKA